MRSEWQRGTQKTKKRTEGPPGLPPIDRKVLHDASQCCGTLAHAGAHCIRRQNINSAVTTSPQLTILDRAAAAAAAAGTPKTSFATLASTPSSSGCTSFSVVTVSDYDWFVLYAIALRLLYRMPQPFAHVCNTLHRAFFLPQW